MAEPRIDGAKTEVLARRRHPDPTPRGAPGMRARRMAKPGVERAEIDVLVDGDGATADKSGRTGSRTYITGRPFAVRMLNIPEQDRQGPRTA